MTRGKLLQVHELTEKIRGRCRVFARRNVEEMVRLGGLLVELEEATGRSRFKAILHEIDVPRSTA